MDAATILEGAADEEAPSFWAVFGDFQAVGRTLDETLDNLMGRLPHGMTGPLIVLPRNQPDEFFTAAQQERLRTLMAAKRQGTLTPAESEERAALIDTELLATGKRVEAWHRALHP
jgi:hypothetical protein